MMKRCLEELIYITVCVDVCPGQIWRKTPKLSEKDTVDSFIIIFFKKTKQNLNNTV